MHPYDKALLDQTLDERDAALEALRLWLATHEQAGKPESVTPEGQRDLRWRFAVCHYAANKVIEQCRT
jgi:hypothetical protein